MKIRLLLFIVFIGLLQSFGGDDNAEENVNPSTSVVNITDITDFDAVVNVSIDNDGSVNIADRGIVFGLSINPTVEDNNISLGSN
jgi:hypothetical protein